jgi:uncharacterized membrane protein YkoI
MEPPTILRRIIPRILFAAAITLGSAAAPIAVAFAKDGGNQGHGGGGDDGGGGGHGGGDHGDDNRDDDDQGGPGRGLSGWDNSGSSEARGAVSHGVALPLARVLPLVRTRVPGKVLNIDLQQRAGGAWVYKFLVLDRQGAYSEVLVDALRNRIVGVRRR